ncbi:MAG: 2-C-methyl-D-erythritol 4-phosphate cytidylyltransferase [Bacillota bacterium]|jgi:2-C-methyl-D-erythritol 4-phosphate cytidylyltransferase/2-C-methyl-D-erythritol 2,4-cyclodiphosphate synthase
MSLTVILLAAGSGSRMGLNHNKVFAMLGKRTVLEWSLETFSQSELVQEIIVVAAATEVTACRKLTKGYPKVEKIVEGGSTRQQSVFNGLAFVASELVAVHDAARPFVSQELLSSLLQHLPQNGGVVPVFAVKDTVKRVLDGVVQETLERNNLCAAQTPQLFPTVLLKTVHQKSLDDQLMATDDASLLEYYGYKTRTVQGDQKNFKLTTGKDLLLAKIMVGDKMSDIRIGNGYDVHRLVEGYKLILGGVEIEHHMGLWGHSDADALCHAIADALLGAACLGDIGVHFPNDDEKFSGVSSLWFLSQIAQMLKDAGWEINNIDSIIIAQKPKMAPHIEKMRENVAQALAINIDKVSIKATTTEFLDSFGREEGIAAQAIALLSR